MASPAIMTGMPIEPVPPWIDRSNGMPDWDCLNTEKFDNYLQYIQALVKYTEPISLLPKEGNDSITSEVMDGGSTPTELQDSSDSQADSPSSPELAASSASSVTDAGTVSSWKQLIAVASEHEVSNSSTTGALTEDNPPEHQESTVTTSITVSSSEQPADITQKKTEGDSLQAELPNTSECTTPPVDPQGSSTARKDHLTISKVTVYFEVDPRTPTSTASVLYVDPTKPTVTTASARTEVSQVNPESSASTALVLYVAPNGSAVSTPAVRVAVPECNASHICDLDSSTSTALVLYVPPTRPSVSPVIVGTEVFQGNPSTIALLYRPSVSFIPGLIIPDVWRIYNRALRNMARLERLINAADTGQPTTSANRSEPLSGLQISEHSGQEIGTVGPVSDGVDAQPDTSGVPPTVAGPSGTQRRPTPSGTSSSTDKEIEDETAPAQETHRTDGHNAESIVEPDIPDRDKFVSPREQCAVPLSDSEIESIPHSMLKCAYKRLRVNDCEMAKVFNRQREQLDKYRGIYDDPDMAENEVLKERAKADRIQKQLNVEVTAQHFAKEKLREELTAEIEAIRKSRDYFQHYWSQAKLIADIRPLTWLEPQDRFKLEFHENNRDAYALTYLQILCRQYSELSHQNHQGGQCGYYCRVNDVSALANAVQFEFKKSKELEGQNQQLKNELEELKAKLKDKDDVLKAKLEEKEEKFRVKLQEKNDELHRKDEQLKEKDAEVTVLLNQLQDSEEHSKEEPAENSEDEADEDSDESSVSIVGDDTPVSPNHDADEGSDEGARISSGDETLVNSDDVAEEDDEEDSEEDSDEDDVVFIGIDNPVPGAPSPRPRAPRPPYVPDPERVKTRQVEHLAQQLAIEPEEPAQANVPEEPTQTNVPTEPGQNERSVEPGQVDSSVESEHGTIPQEPAQPTSAEHGASSFNSYTGHPYWDPSDDVVETVPAATAPPELVTLAQIEAQATTLDSPPVPASTRAPATLRATATEFVPAPRQTSSSSSSGSVDSPAIVQAPGPVQPPAHVQAPDPIQPPAPVQNPGPIRPPAPSQDPGQIRQPAPAQAPGQIHVQAPGPARVQVYGPYHGQASGPPYVQAHVQAPSPAYAPGFYPIRAPPSAPAAFHAGNQPRASGSAPAQYHIRGAAGYQHQAQNRASAHHVNHPPPHGLAHGQTWNPRHGQNPYPGQGQVPYTAHGQIGQPAPIPPRGHRGNFGPGRPQGQFNGQHPARNGSHRPGPPPPARQGPPTGAATRHSPTLPQNVLPASGPPNPPGRARAQAPVQTPRANTGRRNQGRSFAAQETSETQPDPKKNNKNRHWKKNRNNRQNHEK